MGADARQARAALNRHVVGHLPRAQGRLAVHGEVSRGSDAMRREGRRTADQGRRSARVGAESATYGQNWRTCWPLPPGGPAASRAARNGSTEGRKMDAQEVENFIPRSDIGTFSTRARERALRISDRSAWPNDSYRGREPHCARQAGAIVFAARARGAASGPEGARGRRGAIQHSGKDAAAAARPFSYVIASSAAGSGAFGGIVWPCSGRRRGFEGGNAVLTCASRSELTM